MKTILLFFYTESPLHAGIGSSLSVIDLPIQRERTTQYPNIQGSGIKGAIRSQCTGDDTAKNAVFGPSNDVANDESAIDTLNTSDANDYAGAVAIGEGHIVLFPVRSLAGIFAYVTCPHILARFGRDASRANVLNDAVIAALAIAPPSDGTALVPENEGRINDIVVNGRVILEEFSFTAQRSSTVTEMASWMADNIFPFPASPEYEYWRNKLRSSLVILPDDAFRDFVVNSTEVTTHIKLDQTTKTVDAETGALWTQEALPADTVMMSALTAYDLRLAEDKIPASMGEGTFNDVIDFLTSTLPGRLQLGGDETTGQGIVAIRWQIELTATTETGEVNHD